MKTKIGTLIFNVYIQEVLNELRKMIDAGVKIKSRKKGESEMSSRLCFYNEEENIA